MLVFTATIEFEAPAADEIGPSDGFRDSDVSVGGNNTVISVVSSGANTYTVEILLTETGTIAISTDFPHRMATVLADGTATVVRDVMRPTIEKISLQTRGNDRVPETAVGWANAFDVVVDPIMDTPVGAANIPLASVTFTVSPTGAAGADVTDVGKTSDGSDGKWIAKITPKANAGSSNIAATTITITVTATDNAGNVSVKDIEVLLAARAGSGTTTTGPPTTTVDPTDDRTGLTVPAQSYVILVHGTGADSLGLPALTDFPDNPAEGSTDTALEVWEGMPNLEDLLYRGGTITLTITKAPDDALIDHDNDMADATTGKKADGKDGTKPRQYEARDLIITEVMAAVNTANVGQDGYLSHQWIEIYNPLKVEVKDVTVSSKYGRPAAGAASTDVLLDRISDVVGGGWKFDGLGQNGFDDDIAATTAPVAAAVPGRANVDFVSFYRKERGKDGHVKSHWATSSDTYFPEHIGTPGASERGSAPTVDADTVSLKPAIFNEVANYPDDDQDYEWIEIRVTDGTHRFKNWEVEIITAAKTIKRVFTLPEIADAQKIGVDGILLVTSTDPAGDPNHPLAPGYNIEKNNANQADGISPDYPVRYIVRKFDNNLPDDGKFVLVLRTRNDRDNHEGIVDIAGWDDDLKVDESGFFSNLWPLRNYPAPVSDKNALVKGTVQRRQHAGIVGTGTTHGDKKDDQVAMRDDQGWTGIGYKRNADATAQNGGTPGYPNGAVKGEGADATDPVVISEVMYDITGRRAQWIELFNTSHTVGVNIDNWSIFVVNHNLMPDGTDYEDGKLSERIDLDGRIPPRQTFLIVSTSGSDGTMLPRERIHNLRRGRGAKLLNPNGFRLTLYAKTHKAAKEHQLVDDAGNLPDAPATSRRSDAQSFMDPDWMLPIGKTEDGDRVSLARRTADASLLAEGDDRGTIESAWVRSDMDPRQDTLGGKTYYGHNSDISSPGATIGGVLPVSLSKFRPERMKDTGEIVVRWITESELNNAGFNILRSETRDGEFTKLNTKLIAGQGTTSERTVYEYADTSAKPNVIYYYQIQDVSLDGQVTPLAITHLRGNVTAAGKLTTTWGELKTLHE